MKNASKTHSATAPLTILTRGALMARLVGGAFVAALLLAPALTTSPAHAAPHGPRVKSSTSAANLPPASYTAEQAQRGAESYKEACAVCHGPALAGAFDAPSLTGRLVANWSDGPLSDLFTYMSGAMPLSSPGALSAEENADILAFILRENGVAAGKTPLPTTAAALGKVRFPKVDVQKLTPGGK
ncbi:MAG: cytochrome c [Acetobacter indonesiensis]|jgi:mono/diheme cytochrome c family protein|nr:cytochrome c [Acetobacter indonesiensis]MCI1546784.1 cytochrome c [Acetobacter indonesiensis]MCI1766179.1 cytochrome c [Acetobacter indonesiensis]